MFEKYEGLSVVKLKEYFIIACSYGNFDTVKYLLTLIEIKVNDVSNVGADNVGKFKIIYNKLINLFDFLSYSFKYEKNIHYIDDGFVSACKNGHLEIVRYLLTSPEFKRHANIHVKEDCGFKWACIGGHMELVRYLLTSQDLKEHADIHADNDSGFKWACEFNRLNVVKYLLTSNELKEHVDVRLAGDFGFKNAYVNNNFDIIKYLIFDMEIKKTKEIKNILFHGVKCDEISRWFKLRDLKSRLNGNSSDNKIMNEDKKIKL